MIAVVAAAVAWIFLAPTALGGGVDYTVTTGTSMSPGIQEGDLAILRASDSYEVGDVVAYESESLGRTVLHRIVDVEGNRFVTQGDANDWLDSDRPTANDVRGRLWARIPGAGAALIRLRSPAALLALASVVALLTALARVHQRVRPSAGRRRPAPVIRRPRRPLAGDESLRHLIGRIAPFRDQILLWCGVAAGISTIIGLVALTTSSSTTAGTQIPYEQRGTYTYSATAPEGPVYQDAELDTGDTLFLKLVDDVQVGFDYRFESDADHEISGTGRLVAELGDSEGWSRSIPITEPTEVEDGRLALASTLDLKAIQGTIDSVQELTGVGSASYTLNVVAQVDIEGTVAGDEVTDVFASPLTFELDELRLRLVSAGEQLTPVQTGTVRGSESVPAAFSVLGLEVPVNFVRLLALFALVVAATGLGLAAGLDRPDDLDEADQLIARYPSLFVEVSRLPDPYGWSVDVDDLEVLVRLAEQSERVVLHASGEDGRVFVLEDRGTTYVHRPPAPWPSPGLLVPVEPETVVVGVGPHPRTNGNGSGGRHEHGEVAPDIDSHRFWS